MDNHLFLLIYAAFKAQILTESSDIKDLRISVLLPCYNESLTIQKVVADFRAQLPHAEIYVYDNNSVDESASLAAQAGAIVRHEPRQGKAYVVRSMFDEIEADVYIMVDADDTYPAEHVQEMLQRFVETRADMLVGNRLTNQSYQKENTRPFHESGNKLVRWLINRIFDAELKDILSGYRIFSRRFVKHYPCTVTGFELETDLSVFALSHQLKIEEVEIAYRDRPDGSSSKLHTYKDGFKILKLLFNLFRQHRPLAFYGLFAFFSLLVGLGLFSIPLMEYIQFDYVYKVPTLITSGVFLLFAIILYSIGLILDNVSESARKRTIVAIKNDRGRDN